MLRLAPFTYSYSTGRVRGRGAMKNVLIMGGVFKGDKCPLPAPLNETWSAQARP